MSKPRLDASKLAKEVKSAYVDERRKTLAKIVERVSSNSRSMRTIRTDPFLRQIAVLSHMMDKYQDSVAQSTALDVILTSPVYDRLDKIEQSEEGKNDGFDYTDHLVQQLLKWFKEDFFKWVNKLDCDACGNRDQSKITSVGIFDGDTQEHLEGGATSVEGYKCDNCGRVNYFPRYNNPVTLLKTRKGRCGEWANCFTLILKSLGLKVRYVWNLEDHVWCEYYSTNLKRWIHLDSCENAFDNPSLYNQGWGKKMSYVFAISENYVQDVSNRYVDPKSDNKLPRNRVNENDLNTYLAWTNSSKLIEIGDDTDFLEISSEFVNDYNQRNGISKPLPSKVTLLNEMLPRQSGSVEWTKMRGEDGM